MSDMFVTFLTCPWLSAMFRPYRSYATCFFEWEGRFFAVVTNFSHFPIWHSLRMQYSIDMIIKFARGVDPFQIFVSRFTRVTMGGAGIFTSALEIHPTSVEWDTSVP